MRIQTAFFRRTAAGLVLGLVITAVPALVSADDTTAQNIATYNKLVEQVLNQGDMAVFDAITTPDFVEHEQMPPGMGQNREGCKSMFEMLRTAFPDLRVKVDDIMADGDKIMAFQTWTGTNKGPFMGMPATGKSVSFNCADVVRFENGKAAEHWGVTDRLGMMQQMHPEMMSMGKMGEMHKGMKEGMKDATKKDTESKSGN